jgi:hypothetical protein
MNDKYGFGGGLDLPKLKKDTAKPRPSITPDIDAAVKAGNALGFVNRDPQTRAKPGPKRTELQDKVTVPGPKRVIDDFRSYCQANDLTLWQGLEKLLEQK